MNARDLKAKLSELLSQELGKYSNNLPSIWCYGGTNPPSSSNGLEVLINDYPTGDPETCSGGLRYHPQYWEVTLKNWKQTSNLTKALAKIQRSFITRRLTRIPANEQTLEQARIYIFDPTFI